MSKKTYDVTLSNSIKVDGKDVTGVDIRKPNSGELRGLKLTDILQMDIDSMFKLLPRITTPPLSPQQVAECDPADLTAMSVKTVSFFAKPGQLKQLAQSS